MNEYVGMAITKNHRHKVQYEGKAGMMACNNIHNLIPTSFFVLLTLTYVKYSAT